MRISHKKKLIFISIPKSGSITGFKLMEEYDAEKCGSFHNVVIPEEYLHYKAFTFTRNPYDRAVSIWHMLTDTENSSDIMKLINSEFYKGEVRDTSFKTFCKWLGTCKEEDYLYELNTSQNTHLLNCNAPNLAYIQLDNALEQLNAFAGIFWIPKENVSEHKTFDEVADQECLDLINNWCYKDFNYGYEKREKI